MNCKPGDLAIFVRSAAGNEGKVVRCVRLYTENELRAMRFSRDLGPVWKTDTAVPTRYGNRIKVATDAFLRPLRDPGDDAVDEVIQRLGKPANHKGKLVNAKPVKLEAL